ncbi:MAG: sulfurtransferase TusA family protein, partial [Anaerolineales bacterium]
MMANEFDQTLDASGLSCPMPIIKTKKAMDDLETGQVLKMISTDPGCPPQHGNCKLWAGLRTC